MNYAQVKHGTRKVIRKIPHAEEELSWADSSDDFVNRVKAPVKSGSEMNVAFILQSMPNGDPPPLMLWGADEE